MGKSRFARHAAVVAAYIAALLATTGSASAWNLKHLQAECGDEEAFKARVDSQRLSDAPTATTIAVNTTKSADGSWQGRVVIDGGQGGQRTFRAATCPEVVDAAILIVAQVLDGLATPPPPPSPQVQSRLTSPIDELSAPAAQPPLPKVRWAGRAGMLVDVGGLPAPAPGGRLALDIGWRWAALSLSLTRFASTSRLGNDGQGLAAYAWQGAVAGRVRLSNHIALGAQIEVGELIAQGLGVETPLEDRAGWEAAGPVARIALWSRGRVNLALDVEALAAIRRPSFVVDGDVAMRPRFTARAAIGVAFSSSPER